MTYPLYCGILLYRILYIVFQERRDQYKMFCSVQGKEVTIQTSDKNASALEDITVKKISGRVTCVETKSGRCFEFAKCPLNHK